MNKFYGINFIFVIRADIINCPLPNFQKDNYIYSDHVHSCWGGREATASSNILQKCQRTTCQPSLSYYSPSHNKASAHIITRQTHPTSTSTSWWMWCTEHLQIRKLVVRFFFWTDHRPGVISQDTETL